MRWLRSMVACLLILVVFIGGALFSHFLGDIKDIFHIEYRSHRYTLDIGDTVQIPYERYESRIIISPHKASANDVEGQEFTFSRVVGKITDHIAKSSLYRHGECSAQPNHIGHSGNVDSVKSKDMEMVISCTIAEKDIAEYKTLLKEIDYLALKNGGLRVEVSSLYPIVDFAQIEDAKQNLRTLLLKNTRQKVEFYSEQTGRHCSLLASSERDTYSPNDVIMRALGDRRLHNDSGYSQLTLPISSDITLPLEQSAPLYLRARIIIGCS